MLKTSPDLLRCGLPRKFESFSNIIIKNTNYLKYSLLSTTKQRLVGLIM